MSPQAPVATNNAAARKPLLPPEEQFWEKYSPHNEFPLSTVGSIAIFVLSFVAIFLGGKYLLTSPAQEPLDLGGEVSILPGGSPGSGGPGTGDGKQPDVIDPITEPDPQPKDVTPINEIARPKIDPAQFSDVIPLTATEARRYVQEGNLAAESFSKIKEDARRDLMKGLGDGGGTGGTGTKGTGASGDITARQKRVLRWTMMFDTSNGADYARQLQAMGAILGIPGPDGKYRILRQLQRPAQLINEDITKIKRIFWIDDKPDSIGPLLQALGLPPAPHVVAFFPENLEKDLLAKELRFKNRPENEILETRFRVLRVGPTYEARVVDQR